MAREEGELPGLGITDSLGPMRWSRNYWLRQRPQEGRTSLAKGCRGKGTVVGTAWDSRSEGAREELGLRLARGPTAEWALSAHVCPCLG